MFFDSTTSYRYQKIIIFFSLFFLVNGCDSKDLINDPHKPKFEIIAFDVVQKELVIKTNLPENVETLTNEWFNDKVKIDGFDGNLTLIINDFAQEISQINDGKRVDVSLSFKALLERQSISQKKLIEGKVTSYGTLTGNFSLSEFDKVIQSAQNDLILRFTRDLKSKI